MKKLSSLLLALFVSITTFAQLTVTVSGNTVTMKTSIPSSDWGSAPVNLYAYADPADTSPNLPATVQILGGWPGTAMVDDGSGMYSVSVDLSTKFPVGTKVNNFKFIYNSPDGGGGYYQNPGGGEPGFNVTDPTHATGYSAVTTLGLTNLIDLKKKSVVVDGQLHTSLKGNLSLKIYEMGGKLVKSFDTNSTGNAIELNLINNGIYIVKISNGATSEVVKFAK